MNPDAQLITVIGGVLVPILVGLLTKLNAAASLKSILNAALAAVTGALSAGQAVGGWSFKIFIISWGTTFAVSIASYYGLWKPTGVTGAVQEKTATVGVG